MGCMKFFKVILVVSIIGCWNIVYANDVEAGDSVNVLNELEVKAQEVTRVEGHLVILPTTEQKRVSANGYALLDNLMLPGLQVDYRTGKVLSMGFPVTLYINGQEADPRSVMSIRPKDVVKIEYIDAPTGKYAKDKFAVNYVIKHYEYGGYLDVDALQTIGFGHGDYNLASSINHGAWTYSLFGGGRYFKLNNIALEEVGRYKFPTAPIVVGRKSESRAHRNDEYAQFRIERQSQGKYLLGKFTLTRNAVPHNDAFGKESIGDAHDDFSRISDQRSLSPKIDLNGQYNLTRTQYLSFGLHGIYSRNIYERGYFVKDFSSQLTQKENAYSGKLGLIYGNKLSKGTFTAEFFQYYNLYDATYSGSKAYWQHLWKSETLGFVSYSTKLSQVLTLQGRLGFEWYQFRLHGHKRQSKFNPRAVVGLRWQKKSQMISWNNVLASSNYGMNTINDALIDINQYMQSQGLTSLRRNASLQSSLYYNARFGKLTFTGIAQYTHNFHPVVNSYSVVGDKVLRSFINNGYSDIVSINAGASYRFTANFVATADVRYLYSFVKSEEAFKHDFVTANARVQWIRGNIMLSAGVNLKRKDFNASTLFLYEYPLSYFFRGSYAYRNILFGFEAQTPFNRSRIYGSIDAEAYGARFSSLNESNYQFCNLSVKYSFDFGRKVSKVKKDIDESINSSLMKID